MINLFSVIPFYTQRERFKKAVSWKSATLYLYLRRVKSRLRSIEIFVWWNLQIFWREGITLKEYADSVILRTHVRDQSHGTNYEAGVFPNLEIRDIPRPWHIHVQRTKANGDSCKLSTIIFFLEFLRSNTFQNDSATRPSLSPSTQTVIMSLEIFSAIIRNHNLYA